VEQKTRTQTTTTVTTLTRADVRNAIQGTQLTEEEERYVRIRFGISEPPTTVLERRGQTFPETRARLALIEADMLQHLAPAGMNLARERIIARLRNS